MNNLKTQFRENAFLIVIFFTIFFLNPISVLAIDIPSPLITLKVMKKIYQGKLGLKFHRKQFFNGELKEILNLHSNYLLIKPFLISGLKVVSLIPVNFVKSPSINFAEYLSGIYQDDSLKNCLADFEFKELQQKEWNNLTWMMLLPFVAHNFAKKVDRLDSDWNIYFKDLYQYIHSKLDNKRGKKRDGFIKKLERKIRSEKILSRALSRDL